MLIIPDKVVVQLTDQNGRPFTKENILIGVRTFATRKNNIVLEPFSSDKGGNIIMNKLDILEEAEKFVSYGIMDYDSLDSASDEIEIYLLTSDHITRNISALEGDSKVDVESQIYHNPIFRLTDEEKDQLMKELANVSAEEVKKLQKYKLSNNEDLDPAYTQTIKDKWNGRLKEYYYEMKIMLKP